MDPYRVLGVNESATDDEIKNAYRRLVKQYHPDRFEHGSKEQAQAAEKLKQVNAAYDTIVKIRKGNYTSSDWSGTPQFAAVRSAIQRGAISEAESILNSISNHSAEWHYLMGIIMLRRGWYDTAGEEFTKAYQMEPGNGEYERAMRAMTQSAGTYRNFGDDDRTINMSSPLCWACLCCVGMGCLSSNFFFPWICCV